MAAENTRNDKKLLKLLSRLRKKAGRVRDLDVQTMALRSLKLPQEAVRKSQLLRTLAEERGKREKKLGKALDKKTVAEVRKRLKRTANNLEIRKNVDPLSLARQKIVELEVEPGAMTEKTLHRFRIAGKRARYIAELAGSTPEATQLVEQLNHMQDSIGDWHDWSQLAEKAAELFGGPGDSALISALRNVTRAKFRQAVSALTETRDALAPKKPASVATMTRRSAPHSSDTPAAVA